MRGAIPPLPQYVSMAWCLVKHRNNFTFTFYGLDNLGSILGRERKGNVSLPPSLLSSGHRGLFPVVIK
jgi:hypothetical protein